MFEFSNEKTEAALESVRMRSHAEDEWHAPYSSDNNPSLEAIVVKGICFS